MRNAEWWKVVRRDKETDFGQHLVSFLIASLCETSISRINTDHALLHAYLGVSHPSVSGSQPAFGGCGVQPGDS